MKRLDTINRCTLRLFIFLTWILVVPVLAAAAAPIKIGVLAFRPKPQTLAQWKPLEAALKTAIPDHDFVVEPLTYPELNSAVTAKTVQFVLTNPGHYVLLKRKYGLSAPLATLAANEQGQGRMKFGGVIFTRAGRTDIKTLADLRGRSIAITDMESLGGFQMQAYEASLIGVHLPQDGTMVLTGMPHDNHDVGRGHRTRRR